MRIARVFRTPELSNAAAARFASGLTPTGWIFILAAVAALVTSRLVEIPDSALTSMALVAGGGVLFLSGLHVHRVRVAARCQAVLVAERDRQLEESRESYRALCARLPAKFLERGTSAAPASMRTGSRGAILVVDDEPLVRRVVRRVLELSGWQVLEAASGREGVERLRQSDEEICCVLLDRVMPGMDGERTFHALRAVRADLPILFVTGVPDPALSQRLSGQEHLGFVDKPFRMAELERQLRRIGTRA
jgi:CheY-like chemotaxis protein